VTFYPTSQEANTTAALTCDSHMSVCFAFIYHIHDLLRARDKPLSAPLQERQNQVRLAIKQLKRDNLVKQLNISLLFLAKGSGKHKGYNVDPTTSPPCLGLEFYIRAKSAPTWSNLAVNHKRNAGFSQTLSMCSNSTAIFSENRHKRRKSMRSNGQSTALLSILFTFFGGSWGARTGVYACKAGTVLFAPRLQSILPINGHFEVLDIVL
jgi:hypothetical protein